MNFRLINVGIADLQVASYPDVLRTILGSCIAICMYDFKKRLVGLSHIMLPTRDKSFLDEKRYADSAIPILLDEMRRNGASTERIVAKIVGGAVMFGKKEFKLIKEIGMGNVKMTREVLHNRKIRIVAEDIGGGYARTLNFYSENGIIKIKSSVKPENII